MSHAWIAAPAALSFIIASFAAALEDPAEGAGALGLKQNLDLPQAAEGAAQDDGDEGVETVVFYKQAFEGNAVFFCCDRSGTMREGTKWKRLQEEVIKVVNGFTHRVQFAVVFFDSQVVKFPPNGRPAEATQAMKAAATAMVLSTSPGSGTCGKPALVTSLNYAFQATSKRKLIIYLSDGYNTCPGHDVAQYGEEFLAEVRQRNGGRVRIDTITLGAPGGHVDEEFMRRLARENGGTMRRVVE